MPRAPDIVASWIRNWGIGLADAASTSRPFSTHEWVSGDVDVDPRAGAESQGGEDVPVAGAYEGSKQTGFETSVAKGETAAADGPRDEGEQRMPPFDTEVLLRQRPATAAQRLTAGGDPEQARARARELETEIHQMKLATLSCSEQATNEEDLWSLSEELPACGDDKGAHREDVANGRLVTQILSSEEVRSTVEAHGWKAFKEPVLFEIPASLRPPFASREELRGYARGRDLRAATQLDCAVASQFGPRILAERRPLPEALGRSCFAQAGLRELEEEDGSWALEAVWACLPEWLRGTSPVLSMGLDGSGVALHKHEKAWLLLLRGSKLWFLYPPEGPSRRAYSKVALCAAPCLPRAVARLAPRDRPRCLLQREGEALFVPAFWWHATINVGETFAIGSQYMMGDVDVQDSMREHPTSAFVLYHFIASLHLADSEMVKEGFKRIMHNERLNFFYKWQRIQLLAEQLPRSSLPVAQRLLEDAERHLSARQRALVLRVAAPSFAYLAEQLVKRPSLLTEAEQAVELTRVALEHLAARAAGGDTAIAVAAAIAMHHGPGLCSQSWEVNEEEEKEGEEEVGSWDPTVSASGVGAWAKATDLDCERVD